MSIPKIQARLEAARGKSMSDQELIGESVALTEDLLAAGRKRIKLRDRLAAVSYTHLTLPTIYSV